MNALSVDSPIQFKDGSTHRFVERSGGVIRLLAEADGTYRDLHISALSTQVAGLPKSFAPSVRDFEQLPGAVRKKAATMADHIQEILTGINPGRNTPPKAEYDMSLTQNQRIEAKVIELKANGIPASRATLMRHIKAYRENGASSLADLRSVRQVGPLDNLHPDILEALTWVIEDRTSRSTRKTSYYIRATAAHLREKLGADAPELPSTPTLYRIIKKLTEGKHTSGSAKTRQSLANRPKPPYAKRINLVPGSELQVDSTSLDILVRVPGGKVERPILTVLFDRATRMVVAFTLRQTGAKAVDHVMLLAQALTPPQNRPDKTAFRELIQRDNPHVKLLSPAERAELEARAPYIHPRAVVMDNGKDFISDAFLAALQQHHIDARFSASRTPTSKPLVERNFGTIGSMFLENFPGYTGRSPEFRGYKVEDEGVMNLFALHELFDDWLLKVWNHRPHGGLPDRMFPSVKLTPCQAYTASTEVASQLELTLTRDDYIAMLPTYHRVISATGVKVENREYDSPNLNHLRFRKTSNRKKKGKHEVKFDPYNPMCAWVKDSEGGWIERPLRDAEMILHPFLEGGAGSDLGDRAFVATVGTHLAGVPAHTGFQREAVSLPALDAPSMTDIEDDDDPTVVVLD